MSIFIGSDTYSEITSVITNALLSEDLEEIRSYLGQLGPMIAVQMDIYPSDTSICLSDDTVDAIMGYILEASASSNHEEIAGYLGAILAKFPKK